MKLVIEGDEGRKSVVPVRDEMTIGRDDGNTVRLPDRNVSRRHARLFRDSGKLLIEDLGSFNGVRVNGRKIGTPTAVKEGDLIEVGDYDLSLQGKLDGAVTHSNGGPPGSPSARTNGVATAIIPASDVVEAPQVELRDLTGAETPRLVGLSGPVKGKEFHLTRTVVKFGRGIENDLTVDHQSVSRAHARFLLEDGHWKVVDNQSANGVRINGDDYAVGGLEPGDTIELGHLKFRFCAPGEKFTLPAGTGTDEGAAGPLTAEEAHAAEERAGSAVRVGAMAVVLLTALAGASWFFSSRGARRTSHGETAPFAAAPPVSEPAPIEARQPPAANAPAGAVASKDGPGATRSAANPATAEKAPSKRAAGASSSSANPARSPATVVPPSAAAPAETKEAQATRLAAASNEKLNAHDFEGAVSDAQAALELAPTARETLCTAYHSLGYGFSYLNDNRSAKKYLEQFKPCCASFGETACAQVEEFLAR